MSPYLHAGAGGAEMSRVRRTTLFLNRADVSNDGDARAGVASTLVGLMCGSELPKGRTFRLVEAAPFQAANPKFMALCSSGFLKQCLERFQGPHAF